MYSCTCRLGVAMPTAYLGGERKRKLVADVTSGSADRKRKQCSRCGQMHDDITSWIGSSKTLLDALLGCKQKEHNLRTTSILFKKKHYIWSKKFKNNSSLLEIIYYSRMVKVHIELLAEVS